MLLLLSTSNFLYLQLPPFSWYHLGASSAGLTFQPSTSSDTQLPRHLRPSTYLEMHLCSESKTPEFLLDPRPLSLHRATLFSAKTPEFSQKPPSPSLYRSTVFGRFLFFSFCHLLFFRRVAGSTRLKQSSLYSAPTTVYVSSFTPLAAFFGNGVYWVSLQGLEIVQ